MVVLYPEPWGIKVVTGSERPAMRFFYTTRPAVAVAATATATTLSGRKRRSTIIIVRHDLLHSRSLAQHSPTRVCKST